MQFLLERAVTVYETEGSFIPNESLIFNGIQNGRTAIAVTEHGISDVKSIYGTNNGVIGINTFSADVVQETRFSVGIATVSPLSGGISTVKARNPLFPGTLIKENDIVEYTDTTAGRNNDPIFARVVSVGTSDFTVATTTAVAGISSGFLPSSTLDVTDLKVLTTNLSSVSDNTLYTPLAKANISNVDLTDASLTIRKTFTVNIASNQLSTQIVAGTNETFLAFDEERYLLTRSDGGTETLLQINLILVLMELLFKLEI